MSKRIFATILAFVMAILNPVITLAESGGLPGGTSNITYIKPSGSGVPNPQPVTIGTGVRISFGSAAPIIEAGISPLTGKITDTDLETKWNQINDLNNNMYWEPGTAAINYYKSQSQSPYLGVVESGSGGFTNIRGSKSREMRQLPFDGNEINKLAWQVYNSGENSTRPGGAAYAYNQTMYDLLCGAESKSAATNPGKWLDDLRALYAQQTGTASVLDTMDAVVGIYTDGGMPDRFREFTWSSTSRVADMGDANQKARWSSIGYLTACVQFAWLAQEMGLADTYAAMANAIARWVVSGRAADMPIIIVEATSEVSITSGGTDAQWVNMTLPAQLQWSYGHSVAEQLFSKWPAGTEGNTDAAIASITNGLPIIPPKGGSQIRQATGMNYENGQAIPATGDIAVRQYCRQLKPKEGNLFGYFPNWTYWVDNPFDGPQDPTPPDTGGGDAFGSFTWKLTPDGMHDKTPEKEVNESSTIYELNISQNNYNANNYALWERVVYRDGIDCNKLRIRIYHISENLAEEQPATKYARDAVKQKGADVTTPINKVTISPTGNITGFPAGTITTPFSTPFQILLTHFDTPR